MATMHTEKQPPPALQIFRAGRHTAMSGASLAFSDADLKATAQAYDPLRHEAPIVVGHPSLDAPAYGWVSALRFADGALEAQPVQLDPAFAELVSRGRYKKISASFYAPDAPSNPVPGVFYLRHVGFLGAQPPAVKGLRAASFADAESGIVEFSDWSGVTNAGLWRRLRDFLISKFGLTEADSVLPDYSISDLEAFARPDPPAVAVPTATTGFAETGFPTDEGSAVTPEEAAALTAENERLKAQVDAAAGREQAARAAALHAEHTAFADGLVSAGRLLPAERALTVAMLDHFAQQGSVVEFADGETQRPVADGLRALLAAVPARVTFDEVAGAESGAPATVAFAAPDGFAVDGERLALHAKAVMWQAAHPEADFVTAIRAVS